VLPTCLELAGGKALIEINGEKTKPLEGRSLMPIFRDEVRTPPEDLCWEWGGNGAIRRGKWKLVWDKAAKRPSWELYDMETDRTELHNLASQKPELVAGLQVAYERWANATGREIQNSAKKTKQAKDE
jgi:arylsulfatase